MLIILTGDDFPHAYVMTYLRNVIMLKVRKRKWILPLPLVLYDVGWESRGADRIPEAYLSQNGYNIFGSRFFLQGFGRMWL